MEDTVTPVMEMLTGLAMILLCITGCIKIIASAMLEAKRAKYKALEGLKDAKGPF